MPSASFGSLLHYTNRAANTTLHYIIRGPIRCLRPYDLNRCLRPYDLNVRIGLGPIWKPTCHQPGCVTHATASDCAAQIIGHLRPSCYVAMLLCCVLPPPGTIPTTVSYLVGIFVAQTEIYECEMRNKSEY